MSKRKLVAVEEDNAEAVTDRTVVQAAPKVVPARPAKTVEALIETVRRIHGQAVARNRPVTVKELRIGAQRESTGCPGGSGGGEPCMT